MALSSSEQEPANEQIIKTGTKLEVTSEDEGFRGSWFTATVNQLSFPFLEFTYKFVFFQNAEGSELLLEFIDAIFSTHFSLSTSSAIPPYG